MKRQRIELAQVAERGNLALAAFKAAQGKRQRPAVQAFVARLDERLAALAQRILAGGGPLGQACRFTVHDPKRRLITAACFEDRVLHHAVMNLAEPRLAQALTEVPCACRPGLGVQAAVQRVQQGLRLWPWVVQVDVQGFFAHIDHAVLRAQLQRRFKGDGFLALLNQIIATGAPKGVGLPIGALTSQHLANAYLDSADRLLRAHPGVHQPVRYMDDIVWFCDSRTVAQASLAALRQHLAQALRLTLKDRVILAPSAQGLRFCGHRVRAGVVLPGPRQQARYRAAVRQLQQAEQQGLPQAPLQRAHDARLAALHGTHSLHWRQRLWAGS